MGRVEGAVNCSASMVRNLELLPVGGIHMLTGRRAYTRSTVSGVFSGLEWSPGWNVGQDIASRPHSDVSA